VTRATTSGALMVCGTASDVGKSQVVAGLCRLLHRRRVRVAPFKGQNMALNSFVTGSGHEIGRSQALQALAAGTTPEVAMNPVLLKPTSDRASQVIVMGRPVDQLDAAAFQVAKSDLRAVVLSALDDLRARFDVVVAEGAGSPAEPNLMANDLVNLGLATAVGIPAVLVGDIERGGVFASLYGTLALLPDDRRDAVGGFVINKFRGDEGVLRPAIVDLERRTGIPCLAVLPHLGRLLLDAEDSLALGEYRTAGAFDHEGDRLDVAVCRLPHLSNFTDLDALAIEPGVGVRFFDHPSGLGDPDLIILPGSKSTVADLAWMRTSRLDRAIARAGHRGSSVVGICAGYQILGRSIVDDVESDAGAVDGLGWIPVTTRFAEDKVTRQRHGTADGHRVQGYEIRHGRPEPGATVKPWFELDDRYGREHEGVADPGTGVWGTSLHGLFEEDDFRESFLGEVAGRRNKRFVPGGRPFRVAREEQIDRFADLLEMHADLTALVGLIERGRR
jgi:adenosylcobyric acid synthase